MTIMLPIDGDRRSIVVFEDVRFNQSSNQRAHKTVTFSVYNAESFQLLEDSQYPKYDNFFFLI